MRVGSFRSLAAVSLTAIALLPFLAGCGRSDDLRSREEPLTLPDFSKAGSSRERKKQFFRFLRPVIESRNRKILEKRRRLLKLYEEHRRQKAIPWEEAKWLEEILREYGVEGLEVGVLSRWDNLLRRVDVVPVDLALIQAAKESGWGRSRFAREGNNLFGQKCLTEGCGMVPAGRPVGAKYEVKKFRSVADSVQSYIHNLNTNGAYRKFRRLRYQQRQAGRKPDGYRLIEGLPHYSERRIFYLDEIRAMMVANRRLMDS